MRFDRPVGPGGYAWWYVDGISDDGAHALTFIAFIGSVFSPYYAWANRRAPADAENFCAFNIALYGGKNRWAMTERRRRDVTRSADMLRIGPSAVRWDGAVLQADIAEFGAPLPRPVRGTIRVTPRTMFEQSYALDAAGRHHWRPISPFARIEVEFTQPRLAWSGRAYVDSNEGVAPLAEDFVGWQWSRNEAGQVFYDVRRRDGSARLLALQFGADGAVAPFAPPPEQVLPMTGWRVGRRTRADDGATARVVKTLEDTPFYARSVIEAGVGGGVAKAVHESLSMERFAAPWVQVLLPFRMFRV